MGLDTRKPLRLSLGCVFATPLRAPVWAESAPALATPAGAATLRTRLEAAFHPDPGPAEFEISTPPNRKMPERGRGSTAGRTKGKAKQASGGEAADADGEFGGIDARVSREALKPADGAAESSGSEESRGGPSDSESEGDRQERRERRAAKDVRARMKQRMQKPAAVLAGQRYEIRRDWPYARTPCSARTASEWLSENTANGRLREYSEQWRRSIGAWKCKQLCIHTTLCEAIDQAIIYDGIDVINSACIEVLVRHCIGLELAFEEVVCEADWKQPDSNLVEWVELEDYDVVRATSKTRDFVAAEAAEQVRRTRVQRAKHRKARHQDSARTLDNERKRR